MRNMTVGGVVGQPTRNHHKVIFRDIQQRLRKIRIRLRCGPTTRNRHILSSGPTLVRMIVRVLFLAHFDYAHRAARVHKRARPRNVALKARTARGRGTAVPLQFCSCLAQNAQRTRALPAIRSSARRGAARVGTNLSKFLRETIPASAGKCECRLGFPSGYGFDEGGINRCRFFRGASWRLLASRGFLFPFPPSVFPPHCFFPYIVPPQRRESRYQSILSLGSGLRRASVPIVADFPGSHLGIP